MSEEGKSILKKVAGVFKPDFARMNAHEAYLKSAFGKTESDNERVKNFIEKIDKLIESRCQGGFYYCSVTIGDDLMKYKDQIVEAYTSIGYDVYEVQGKRMYILCIEWSDKYFEEDN